MIVRVSKRRWLRGIPGESSLLLGTKMCCLGFAARQLGQKAKDIAGVSMPGEMAEDRMTSAMCESPFVRAIQDTLNQRDYFVDTDFSRSAAAINDDGKITDTERMRRLRVLFKESGHKIIFVP